MMHAVISESAAARLEAAVAFLARWGPDAEVVVVGATREAADDFCRQAAARRGATFGLHRFTLAQFAARVAGPALAARGLGAASALAAEAVAARALFEAARDAPLGYLAPIADAPGLPRALASTIGELREAGLPPQVLATLPAAGPDLAHLLAQYATQLASAGVADRADLLGEAARLVRARAPQALTGRPVLLLDVRLSSLAERDLVAALGETAPAVLVTVPAGDERTMALLPPGAERLTPAPETPSRPLARLRRELFAPETQASAEPGGLGDEVQFFSAPGEGREAIEVARRVLDEADRGVPFDEIAIVVRSPELYWGPLEQALARAKIPAWFARGTRRPDPTGRAFLALLACRAEGLSARRFGEYLSLGQVPRRDEAGAPAPDPPPLVAPRDEAVASGQLSLFDLLERRPVAAAAATAGTPPVAAATSAGDEPAGDERTDLRTPWKWESLLVEAAVVGGAGRWRRRLDGLSRELALRARELDGEEAGSPQAAAIARDREALDELRRFALPLIDDLAALPETATWGEWLARFTALAPRALRHPARVLELLADLRPLAAIGEVTLAEVRRVLVPRLAQLEREPPRLRFGRVFVCTPDQLRGRTFRIVCVLGLAERLFPQRSRQDPLLLDASRARVAQGVDLPVGQGSSPAAVRPLIVEDDRVAAERVLLRLVAGAATERLFVSYPRLDVVQGRARVPSFYALDVVRALTGAVPHYETFERETAQQTGAWLAWPAPEDPEVAVDAWEHDLAVLGRLLRPTTGERPARGSAHYLLTLNDALRRSLRARYARWKKRWTAWDGLIGQPEQEAVRVRLAAQRLTARPYSVSALQRFASCPYQFLLGSIYRFEPLERPESIVSLDPLTRGALFHEIQRDVWRALSARGLLPLPADRREAVRVALEEVCDAAFTRARDELVPAILRVWEDETDLMRADLRMWLDRLIDAGGEWVPRHFELGFGLRLDDAHDPASVPDPVRLDGRFPIRGAIDLIEEHAVFGTLRVTDHKTGRNRTTPALVVGGGATLQPVVYALVAEQIFGKRVMQSRLSFATTAGEFSEHEVSLREPARRAGIEVLEIIDRAIESGSLPPAPRPGACAWCDFRAVCGPLEEKRLERKTRELPVIADLDALRRLP